MAPARSATARRLYTDDEIERLLLLRQATLAGHSIGQIANLPTERLGELVEADKATRPQATFPIPVILPAPGPETSGARPVEGAATFLDRAITAIESLDAETLIGVLSQAAVVLGSVAMMEQVIVPLMHKIGDCWRQGSLRVSHEHLASAMVRTFLGDLMRSVDPHAPAPVLVVTTPSGQLHELGALMAAVTAASEGWRVAYLGPNLPVEEIAAATLSTNARVVALSLSLPLDDFKFQDDLRKLRSYISDDVVLIVGGRAAEAYSSVIAAAGAVKLDDMLSLRTYLEALRAHPAPAFPTSTPDPSATVPSLAPQNGDATEHLPGNNTSENTPIRRKKKS